MGREFEGQMPGADRAMPFRSSAEAVVSREREVLVEPASPIEQPDCVRLVFLSERSVVGRGRARDESRNTLPKVRRQQEQLPPFPFPT